MPWKVLSALNLHGASSAAASAKVAASETQYLSFMMTDEVCLLDMSGNEWNESDRNEGKVSKRHKYSWAAYLPMDLSQGPYMGVIEVLLREHGTASPDSSDASYQWT
jgi:hypothetical protein